MKWPTLIAGLIMSVLLSNGTAFAAKIPAPNQPKIPVASADPTIVPGTVPSLKIAPLKYQASVELNHPQSGFIDISNPTGSPVHLAGQVQAFRQTDPQGDLEFYDDAAVQGGIHVTTTDFVLGPREAARISFTIDPNRLPHGGVYAAVFFRTVPSANPSAGTQVFSSARVGTLLILDIGGQGKKTDQILSIKIPWFIWDKTISGQIDVRNPTGHNAIAFNPKLAIQPGWLQPTQTVNGPLIFPGNHRLVDFKLTSNYFGPMHLSAHDTVGNGQDTRWIFAITGFWRWLSLLIPTIIIFTWLWFKRRQRRK